MTVENVSSQPALQRTDIIQNSNGSDEIKLLNQKSNSNQQIKEPTSKEELEKVITSFNDFIESSSTHIQFKLHEKLNEYYVTVVDNKTNEVIREIPSRKVLDIYAAMTEFIGLIVDKKI